MVTLNKFSALMLPGTFGGSTVGSRAFNIERTTFGTIGVPRVVNAQHDLTEPYVYAGDQAAIPEHERLISEEALYLLRAGTEDVWAGRAKVISPEVWIDDDK